MERLDVVMLQLILCLACAFPFSVSFLSSDGVSLATKKLGIELH